MTEMDAKKMDETISRLAREILERNRTSPGLAVVGIRTRGALLASRLAEAMNASRAENIPVGFLDITLYRDDLHGKLHQPILQNTEISFDVTGRTIILVDDVLFTGRTIRAALNALVDIGRPASIQLAVLVDRNHRELPIHADFTGMNVPTTLNEEIKVAMKELDGEDAVQRIPAAKEGA